MHSVTPRLTAPATLLLALFALGCAPDVPTAPPTAARSAGGAQSSTMRLEGCAEFTLFFQSMDPAAVAARLPEGFTPFVNATTGRGVVWLTMGSCASGQIDAGAPRAVSYVLVAARVSTPEGGDASAAARHFYTLQAITDDGELHGRLTSAGFPSALVKDIELLQPAPSRATLDVGGGDSPFTASVTGGLGSGSPHGHALYFWSATRRGHSLLAFDLHSLAEYSGTGTFDSEPGSPFDELLGGQVVSRGVTGRFSVDATVTAG